MLIYTWLEHTRLYVGGQNYHESVFRLQVRIEWDPALV